MSSCMLSDKIRKEKTGIQRMAGFLEIVMLKFLIFLYSTRVLKDEILGEISWIGHLS